MPVADWFRLILLSLLWGGSFFFVQVAVGALPPLSVVLARVALGAAILWLALRALGVALPRGIRVWQALAVMGLLNNAVPFTLFAFAQGQIDSALAAILNATTPLFGVVVAHLALADERMTQARAAGVVLGFLGVAVMLAGGGAAGAPGTLAAQVACLAAAFSYALAGVWGRRFRAMGVQPAAAALGQLVASSLWILPLALWFERPWTLPLPEAPVLLALLGLAALSTALAYLIYFRILNSAGAVNLLLVTFLIPVSAMALGVLILDEVVLPRHLAGLALIALGLAVLDGRLLRRARR